MTIIDVGTKECWVVVHRRGMAFGGGLVNLLYSESFIGKLVAVFDLVKASV